MEDKRSLRKRVRGLMEAQAPADRRRRSLAIEEKLFALDAFRQAKAVCFYVSMPHEVDTEPMIDKALARGMRVCVPRCDGASATLTLYAIGSRDELVPGTWGILEPSPDASRVVKPEEVGCVIVPGVAFDAEGGRVGNGKGFYDRFLKTLRPDAAKIGLAFSLQMVPGVPAEAHDVKLDLVLTD